MPLFQNANPYRRRRALFSSGSALVFGAVLLLAALIAVVHIFLPGVFMNAASPVFRASNGASNMVASAVSVFADQGALTRERDQLRSENLALNEENRRLRALIADVHNLTPSNRIRAGVLARPPVAPYDTLLVSLPQGVSVSSGAYAYGPGGVPLGTVDTATGGTARIALYSTGGRETAGWVGEDRLPITLTGQGAGAFFATLPRESGVAVGDVVYVPGPGALPIGSVVRIDTDPASPRQTVRIAPYANLFSLTWIELAP